ncbi:hypothetical protein ACET3Z_012555 [Daucus carota]
MADSFSAEDDEVGVLREIRATPPAHFMFKIQSFSLFSENGLDEIRSNNLQAGEHQWKLKLFPKEKFEGNGDHVSIYLMLESTGDLVAGKGVDTIFKFFLFDQIRGRYLTVQGRARRFDRVKDEWGFAKFISLTTFEDPTNGFLVDDTCYLGAEVSVLTEGSCIGECLSISKVDHNFSGKYKWVIHKFSELGEKCDSDVFTVGRYTWKLVLYPEGISNYKGFCVSLFLEFADSSNCTSEHEVKAHVVLKIIDHYSNQSHIQKKGSNWFGVGSPAKGWHSFIELKDLKDRQKGYLAQDICIIEAEVKLLCETSHKSLCC